jgi:hypothetical protein
MKVAGMRVERFYLFTDRFHHPWMAVPDVGNIIVDVQVSLAIGTGQPDTFPFDDMQGPIVKETVSLSEQLISSLNQCLC